MKEILNSSNIALQPIRFCIVLSLSLGYCETETALYKTECLDIQFYLSINIE